MPNHSSTAVASSTKAAQFTTVGLTRPGTRSYSALHLLCSGNSLWDSSTWADR